MEPSKASRASPTSHPIQDCSSPSVCRNPTSLLKTDQRQANLLRLLRQRAAKVHLKGQYHLGDLHSRALSDLPRQEWSYRAEQTLGSSGCCLGSWKQRAALTILHQDLNLISQGQRAQLSHGQDIAGSHRLVSVGSRGE